MKRIVFSLFLSLLFWGCQKEDETRDLDEMVQMEEEIISESSAHS